MKKEERTNKKKTKVIPKLRLGKIEKRRIEQLKMNDLKDRHRQKTCWRMLKAP